MAHFIIDERTFRQYFDSLEEHLDIANNKMGVIVREGFEKGFLSLADRVRLENLHENNLRKLLNEVCKLRSICLVKMGVEN